MSEELSKEQLDSLQQLLQQGTSLEVLTKQREWAYIKDYFTSKVQAFTSSLLVKEDKPITDFENERREIIGLRKLFGWIENSIKTVEDDREKARKSTKK